MKPVSYYLQDIYPINPVIGGRVVCKIIGHPRQEEFQGSGCQITSLIVAVSDDCTEFETLNTYYKPFRSAEWI